MPSAYNVLKAANGENPWSETPERIKADDPSLALNIIKKAIASEDPNDITWQAVAVIKALHEAGLKIGPY